ncbi:hypothetical protein [aff. Roholtiella sp. LEGE 12411]|uniref:hypothetical protein n=2 Tax=aff. Roholtiella sp. LEGE 12411 TaxID=1828822 RepID=UPI00187E02B3|nr:hypothetical protein [aff. Roholtiella sp. LEGE 12411]
MPVFFSIVKWFLVENRAWGMGHWAWGIGHWAWGMGHGALGIAREIFILRFECNSWSLLHKSLKCDVERLL